MANPCPRCSADILPSETSHDYNCLEALLVQLYQIGVKRGLHGEQDGDFDDRASDLIGDVLSFVWPWREAANARKAQVPSAAITVAMDQPRARVDHDLNTLMARLLGWQNVGWLNGVAVSGEAAWYDGRVIRRRFSERYEDAVLIMRLPLMRSLELVQIHRLHTTQWEWHVSRKSISGDLESVVREPSASLAICRAALMVAGLAGGAARVG